MDKWICAAYVQVSGNKTGSDGDFCNEILLNNMSKASSNGPAKNLFHSPCFHYKSSALK